MTVPRRPARPDATWTRTESPVCGRCSAPESYAVVFVDDDGSPTSVGATFPGPMSAEMYGRIVGGKFRVVPADAARVVP
ncbi:hypothetical protein ND748_03835 [Frankia sp. AiPs1]|uniref:hypothetical protein n=1 Tax=Frankia sp. AiPs1 TaxID=573493 RepID=UPI002043637C|nr:hypothetical protein [Frankia sp. AiPs1]MCM3920808.1 hypothetical protein [Frankia sp. AiPs1]